MSHTCCRKYDKKVSNVLNKQLIVKAKSCCSVRTVTTDCKCLDRSSKTNGQQKMKRLKTRRERSHTRTQNEIKSRHHRRDMEHSRNCCHSTDHCCFRKGSVFTSVVPTAQEPSIITGSRLIGHHGLFNQEVKSVNIERLLSEQKKREQTNKCVNQKDHKTLRMSSASHIVSPLSSECLFAPTNDASPFIKNIGPSSEAFKDYKVKDKEKLEFINKELDVTRGLTQEQLHDISPGSLKSTISSQNNSTVKKSSNEGLEKRHQSQLTPFIKKWKKKTLNKKSKRLITSTPEHSHNSLNSPVCQMLIKDLQPSTPVAGTFDSQHRGKDPEHVSKCISAVAARLYDTLRFPLLEKKNLVSKSREALMKSLRELHGPWLQENLRELQPRRSVQADSSEAVQNQHQEKTDFQKHLTDKKTLHSPFSPESSSFLSQSLRKWLTSPVEASGSLPEDIIGTSVYSPFCMETDSPRVLEKKCFAPIPATSREETISPYLYGKSSNISHNMGSHRFDSSECSIQIHTRAHGLQSSGQLSNDMDVQPVLSYPVQLPNRWAADPMLFYQNQDPIETDSLSFDPSFPAQVPHPSHSRGSNVFNLSSYAPTACMSNNTDMMHFPPSHMLNSSPTLPSSLLPSPEHWSFPPMRLY
ncbi:proline-rich protein 19 [Gouania willdenowi]|uniref:proline-rich protein 19 n=1 Tax=Gouania willdenowi TaxID=441366 RepID=UPI001055DED7|nr:uncharacterized protein LOC114477765 [Gouania willdenowi]